MQITFPETSSLVKSKSLSAKCKLSQICEAGCFSPSALPASSLPSLQTLDAKSIRPTQGGMFACPNTKPSSASTTCEAVRVLPLDKVSRNCSAGPFPSLALSSPLCSPFSAASGIYVLMLANLSLMTFIFLLLFCLIRELRKWSTVPKLALSTKPSNQGTTFSAPTSASPRRCFLSTHLFSAVGSVEGHWDGRVARPTASQRRNLVLFALAEAIQSPLETPASPVTTTTLSSRVGPSLLSAFLRQNTLSGSRSIKCTAASLAPTITRSAWGHADAVALGSTCTPAEEHAAGSAIVPAAKGRDRRHG
mmetsp:Transcript_7990/g.20489  ORF Transcript_7990/g.20489 Transcript_7990/m.20489 type:complete len:306 (-) Transcript_7990:57-974(-)